MLSANKCNTAFKAHHYLSQLVNLTWNPLFEYGDPTFMKITTIFLSTGVPQAYTEFTCQRTDFIDFLQG